MPPEDKRRLVLDEDMNWKLGRELRNRGMRDATSCMELGLANQSIKDRALIKRLSAEQEPCVLVAWGNKMYRQHRQALQHFNFTLAVIDRDADRGGLNDEEYYRDVIHRHAHRTATQAQGEIWKYSRVRRRRLPLGKSSEVWR